MTHTDDQKTKDYNTAFMRGAMAEKILSRDDEIALARDWLDHKNEASLHALITAHHRLAVAIAAKFRAYGLPLGDLIQEGTIGLLEAANRFDPTREVRFSTYATWWIRASLQDYILRNWSMVRTGTTAAQKSLFFNLRRLRARIEAQTDNRYLSADDKRIQIAKTLQVPLKDVEAMEQRLGGRDASLNMTLSEDSNDEWLALLPDTRPNPEEIVIGMKDAKTRSRWLAEAIGTLSDRERTIITRRHLSSRAETLDHLGITLGVSKERVRQIEARALEKIKDHLSVHVPDQGALFA